MDAAMQQHQRTQQKMGSLWRQKMVHFGHCDTRVKTPTLTNKGSIQKDTRRRAAATMAMRPLRGCFACIYKKHNDSSSNSCSTMYAVNAIGFDVCLCGATSTTWHYFWRRQVQQQESLSIHHSTRRRPGTRGRGIRNNS